MEPALQLRLLGSCGEVEVQAQSTAQDFNKVIYASFAAMAVVYGLVAGLGYYYFGDAASTLVTNDLTNNSPYTGRWVRFRVLAGHGWAASGSSPLCTTGGVCGPAAGHDVDVLHHLAG